MARVLQQSTKDEIKRLAATGLTVSEIAKRLLVGHVAVRNYVREFEREQAGDAPGGTPEAQEETVEVKRQFREEGDTAEVRCDTPHEVRTLEDAIRYGEVDTSVWKVVKWECTSWETVAKDEKLVESKGKDWKVKTPKVHQLWRVHLKLERIVPDPFVDATEAILEKIAKLGPSYSVAPAIWKEPAPYFMEADLFDVHFGNLSWAAECRENDDLKIKEAVFAHAIDDIMVKTDPYPVSEVIFPVGNDLMHFDTLTGTTTAGTPQDCDGRYAKVIEVAEGSVIRGVERMLARTSVRKIKIIYVPGNHDVLSSLHLCRTLSAWFRNTERVEVDLSPAPHKYLEMGVCLFGYIHGDHASASELKELPLTMATEEPQAWSRTTCREWKLGHVHTSKSDEIKGVMVRRLRALTGTNAWHTKKLYVGNSRAAEVYLYNRDSGYEGHFVARARP